MMRILSGILATIVITMFLGGLAYSIWDNTGSVAFPIIVAVVLVMAYVSFFDELRSGGDNS